MSLTDELIQKVKNVAPLSRIARLIMSIMSRRNYEIGGLIRLIETEASLTARILAIANTLAGDDGSPAVTVQAAMDNLGVQVVLGIALDCSTDGLMLRPLEGYDAGGGKLWEHNLLTALAARIAAQSSPCTINSQEAFTGGLLHDIGKAVISDFLKGSVPDMVRMVDNGAVSDYLSAEEDILGTNHCIIGAAMAGAWQLPSPLPDIIRHHHNPLAAVEQHRPIVAAVHLGDIIAMMKGCCTGADAMCYRLQPGLRDMLGIAKSGLPGLMLQVDEEFQKIKQQIQQGAINEKDTAGG